MKKTLLSLLLFIVATTMSGQTMLRGDMNGDGKLTLADLTALANVIVGKAPTEAINVYEVDNTTVIGTWYASDGTVLHFNEDGTTDYMGESTYEFMPFLASLLIYDATGSVVKTMKFKNVTPKYLLEESTINGALTYYTNSSYIVSDITLNQSTLSLNSGSTYQLRTTVAPVAALNSSVIWTSSDESVATVNANGLVTAVAGGSCIITCKAADGGGASTSCEVTVIQMVTEITLSQTILILQPDDFQKLTATISPSNAVNNGVTWTSSDENVAEVTSTGGVVAIDWGVCTITCTAKDGSGVSAICHVKVFKQPEYVDLSLPSGTLWATWNVGASRPEEYGDCFAWGETTGLLYGKTTFSWDTYNLCNGSMATLTKYCNNSAYGNDGYSDTLMELEPEDDAAYVNWGSEWRMPSDDQFEELINSNNTTIDWTTQNDVNGIRITSNANGNSIFLPATGYRYEGSNGVGTSGNYWSRSLGTGNSNYSFDLCFSSDNRFMDYSNRCNGRSVRPVLNRVMSITLNEPILTMNPGTTAQLTATISPSSINSSMMWTSSDENVATVDANGQVTAVAGGTCIITCTAQDGSGKNATCEVSVVQLVTRIILSHSTLSLNVGTTSQLTSSVQPSDASNKNVTWTSSNENVATVDADGVVAAVSRGACTITCIAQDVGGVSATCEVAVNQLVTGIVLSQSTLSVNSGSSTQLTASVQPSNANNMSLTWTSSNENVATVDADGVVTAFSRGTCTITCMAQDGSGVEATCEVKVNQLVTNITLSHTTLVLHPEEDQKITVTVLPSDASNKGRTWTSSDESVAEVANNGTVYAMSPGTCTITCTAKDGSGVTATCEVTVVQPVTDITLSSSSIFMRINDTHQFTATVLPFDAYNKKVTWTSSDENVATVDVDGVVTAVSCGTCTITCMAQDGSGKNATCEVSVVQLVTGITLSQSALSLNVGTTSQLTASVQPSDASNKNVTWTSSNINVATVNDNGQVTGVASGTCTITATAQDSSGVAATCALNVFVDHSGNIGGRKFVDLGLPSGTIWATTNVGATSPEDYGYYFAWGETRAKQNYTWATYLWCDGSGISLTKYNYRKSQGVVDNKTVLDLEDDAAYINWGNAWCMPTPSQIDELKTHCIWTWTTLNAVEGYLVTGQNGYAIFLHSSGMLVSPSSDYHSPGVNEGIYWTNTLTSDFPEAAGILTFNKGTIYGSINYIDNRYLGHSVRPVRVRLVTGITLSQSSLSLTTGVSQTLTATIQPSNASRRNVTWMSSNANVASVSQTGRVTAVGAGSCTITCAATDSSGKTATCSVTVTPQLVTAIIPPDPNDYVDLSLPSGTLWATCNIGADNPEDYGLYFAWGETTGYTGNTSDGRSFNWASYKYCNGSGDTTITKYCNGHSYSYNSFKFADSLKELEPEDDAAYVNWGSGWRMPSKEQFDELINSSYTTKTWTTQNGVYGRLITSKNNGNSIFLPAAGYRYDTSLRSAGSYGYYWSRTLGTLGYGWDLYFHSSGIYSDNDGRCRGFAVRPVRVSQN